MINIKSICGKVANVSTLLSESKKSHLKHLFEDGTLTFDDMRSIFNQVFTGKVRIVPNVKKINLMITYKNGEFALANDHDSVKSPFMLDKVCKRCKCTGHAKDVFLETVGNIIKSFDGLDQKDLNGIFANGQNYYSIDIIVPPEEQLADYGNKCFVQCNKVNCYDSDFKNITEDDDNTAKLTAHKKFADFLNTNNVCINQDQISSLKSSTSPDVALKEVLAKLENIVDGIGYKATVNDYVRERYAKYIVNCALRKGIDVYRNSDFVNELIARLSYVSDHRPNRSDLITHAKRAGIDWRTDAYRELISYLESTAEETNDAIIQPIEELVTMAGVLLMKCLIGIISVDPRASVRTLRNKLNAALTIMQDGTGLTPDKIRTFRRCMKGLDTYQSTLPTDGIMILHNGKVCKIKGDFGEIKNIVKLMNY